MIKKPTEMLHMDMQLLLHWNLKIAHIFHTGMSFCALEIRNYFLWTDSMNGVKTAAGKMNPLNIMQRMFYSLVLFEDGSMIP